MVAALRAECVGRPTQYPTGDYRAMVTFFDVCEFGPDSVFDDRTNFVKRAVFGSGCKFGRACSFGPLSEFGTACSFGPFTTFDVCCVLATLCTVGSQSVFGSSCQLAPGVILAPNCMLSNRRKTPTITKQKRLRDEFWAAHPQFKRCGTAKHDTYDVDVRAAFCDYVALLAHTQAIDTPMAKRATL